MDRIGKRLTGTDAARRLREFEARVEHQRLVAAKLAQHGFVGAAAQVLARAAALQGRLGANPNF